MQRVILWLATLLLLLGFSLVTAESQTVAETPQKRTVIIDKRKLLVQPRNADGTIMETPFTEDPVLWMRTKQQNFYGRMNNLILSLRRSAASTAAWTLVTISFFYGVFHAAGPGHGKAVVTGWVLATENELKRGLFIAFLCALFQALTAIVAVSIALLFFASAAATLKTGVEYLESWSFLMIAAMGLYLVWNGWTSFQPRPATLSAAATAGPFELMSRPDNGLALEHVHDENCGHAHVPGAAELKGDWSWKRAFVLAFAVGIRPCSGAIAVLLTSYTLGLFWVGVVSTFAMGLGVFVTIATIASLAVYGKTLAHRLASADNRLTAMVVKWGKIVLGFLIAGFGLVLFLASLGANTTGM